LNGLAIFLVQEAEGLAYAQYQRTLLALLWASGSMPTIPDSLPDSVVMADTVIFKNRLDKHWANYAFLYDYLVNYNGTESLFVV